MDIWGRELVGEKTERKVVIFDTTWSARAGNGADTEDNNERDNDGGDSGTPTRAPPPQPNISSAPPSTATLPS